MTYIVKFDITEILTEKLKSVIIERKDEEQKVFKDKGYFILKEKE